MAGGRSRVAARAILNNEPASAELDEDDHVVARALEVESGALASSTGSDDDELARRIAAGEFSSVSPLVTFIKPLRKQLAQLGSAGASPPKTPCFCPRAACTL